eukprot:1689499-Ditylum_brightwellii.AAC.1
MPTSALESYLLGLAMWEAQLLNDLAMYTTAHEFAQYYHDSSTQIIMASNRSSNYLADIMTFGSKMMNKKECVLDECAKPASGF